MSWLTPKPQRIIVQDELLHVAEEARGSLPIAENRYLAFGRQALPGGLSRL